MSYSFVVTIVCAIVFGFSLGFMVISYIDKEYDLFKKTRLTTIVMLLVTLSQIVYYLNIQ